MNYICRRYAIREFGGDETYHPEKRFFIDGVKLAQAKSHAEVRNFCKERTPLWYSHKKPMFWSFTVGTILVYLIPEKQDKKVAHP